MMTNIEIWNETLCNSLTASKKIDRNDIIYLIQYLWENHDKGHIRNIQIKCTTIIMDQYTIAENVP